MGNVKNFCTAERLYYDVIDTEEDSEIVCPAGLYPRVRRLMMLIKDPFKYVLNEKYNLNISDIRAISLSEEESDRLLKECLNSIRNSPKLMDVLVYGNFNSTVEDIWDIDISYLDIPDNVRGYLRSANIQVIGDLMEMTRDELSRVDQMSTKQRVNTVMRALGSIGASFREDDDWARNLAIELGDEAKMSYAQKIIALCSGNIKLAEESKLEEAERNRIYGSVNVVLSGRESDVLMHVLKGYSFTGCANSLEITENGAKALLTKAVKRLREPMIKKYVLYGENAEKFEEVQPNDPIEVLGLSGATTNILKRNGYLEVRDVLGITLHEFTHLDRFGARRYSEVLLAIKEKVR